MTKKQSVGLARLLRSDWSKVKKRGGVPPNVHPPTKFVDTGILHGMPIMTKYWRDRATRTAIEDRIDAYTAVGKLSFCHDSFDRACEQVFSHLDAYLGDQTITPHTFKDIWPELNKSAGSGYPFLERKGKIRDKLFREYAKNLRTLKRHDTVRVYPCRMGSRCVVRLRPENKPRLVWVYPSGMTTLEARYAIPLINALHDYPRFGWSYRWMDEGKGYETWYNSVRSLGNSVVSLDFSSFDSTVPSFAIRKVFDWIKSKFTDTLVDSRAWKLIIDYFIHTPLLAYDGVFVKHRGIPSGSYFTSIIGSISNLIFQYYVYNRMCIVNRIHSIAVLGDDSHVVIYNDSVDVAQLLPNISMYAHELGMTVHPEKSQYWGSWMASDPEVCEIKFLGLNLVSSPPYIRGDLETVAARVMWPEVEDLMPSHTMERIYGLVWSYGFHYETYRFLSTIRDYLIHCWPDLSTFVMPNQARDREVQRWLHFVYHEKLPLSFQRWPCYQEIRARWFGFTESYTLVRQIGRLGRPRLKE